MIDTDFPVESKFDELPGDRRPRGVVGVPHHPGGLRQVLHLLRRALHARRRAEPAGAPTCCARRAAWWPPGARELTLLGQNVNAYHGAGADGASWGLARLVRALAELAGPGAHPLHDLAPARHGRRPDPRARRGAAADAVPAPAGAVRLRRGAGGDEPHATPPTTTAAWSSALRAARPDLALSSDFIVGFPGETDADFAATLRPGRARSASRRPSRSSTAPARARPPPGCAGRWPSRSRPSGWRPCRQLLDGQAAAFNRACVGLHAAGAARAARPPSGPARRPHALSAGGPRRRPAACRRRHRAGRRSPSVIRTASPAVLAPPAAPARGRHAPDHPRTAPGSSGARATASASTTTPPAPCCSASTTSTSPGSSRSCR